MKHRLIIVEGLPCAGKSTVAAGIAAHLGDRAVCVDEGTGDHPADYECHALTEAGDVVSLAELPQEERERLLPRKIYDGLPWETEAPLMLDKWRQFVRSADSGRAYVFNCVLLQNPMCETMMRFDLPEAASAAHIRAISEIIAPMNPLVVYLRTQDVAALVRRAAPRRPGWLEAVIPYHTEGGYGRAVGAEGFDGYIRCLEERQAREMRILQQLPLASLVLDAPSEAGKIDVDGIAAQITGE